MAKAPETPAILWKMEAIFYNLFTMFLDLVCNAGAIADSGNLYKGRRKTQIWREIKMADDEELYLANLDEFVNDEDKIVSPLLVYGKPAHFSFGIVYFPGWFISGYLQMVESYLVSARQQS